jgi:hypothetical protein
LVLTSTHEKFNEEGRLHQRKKGEREERKREEREGKEEEEWIKVDEF